MNANILHLQVQTLLHFSVPKDSFWLFFERLLFYQLIFDFWQRFIFGGLFFGFLIAFFYFWLRVAEWPWVKRCAFFGKFIVFISFRVFIFPLEANSWQIRQTFQQVFQEGAVLKGQNRRDLPSKFVLHSQGLFLWAWTQGRGLSRRRNPFRFGFREGGVFRWARTNFLGCWVHHKSLRTRFNDISFWVKVFWALRRTRTGLRRFRSGWS